MTKLLGITYSISKLYIQNNLLKTIKYENKCFYLYSNLGFEYRIKKMKSTYTTFWNQIGPYSRGLAIWSYYVFSIDSFLDI